MFKITPGNFVEPQGSNQILPHHQTKTGLMARCYLAERQGFEPWEGCPSTVFKTAAFDRSATSPFQSVIFRVALSILLTGLAAVP
jgi:hypothetical protein